jgi:hypothetical protein
MEKDEAKAELLRLLKPGDTVFTVLRHVSSSGMHRRISLMLLKDGDYRCIDSLAVHAGLGRFKRKTTYGYNGRKSYTELEGIVADGCGTDMGFDLVYRLGKLLWPDGTPEVHGTRNGQPDRDGGYALKHRWM